MCTSINDYTAGASDTIREGWGWNYVNCIESVVVGFHRQNFDPTINCWKMTTLCRDIFRTHNLDEYGIGPQTHTFVDSPPTNYILALLAGLISSLYFLYIVKKPTGRHQLSTENYRTISDEPENLSYQQLEDTEQEHDRRLIEDTMSLLGLD
jgi:hypothetical protein